jgi:hypothetical protein
VAVIINERSGSFFNKLHSYDEVRFAFSEVKKKKEKKKSTSSNYSLASQYDVEAGRTNPSTPTVTIDDGEDDDESHDEDDDDDDDPEPGTSTRESEVADFHRHHGIVVEARNDALHCAPGGGGRASRNSNASQPGGGGYSRDLGVYGTDNVELNSLSSCASLPSTSDDVRSPGRRSRCD